ncbi:MAG: HD domain-containing protein [Lachnospiraceae bacterium]|nr:HD domain-containing protein [Lachnospiraceae bacterium]
MKEIVSSKDVCIMIREVLRLMDKRLIGHGERVGYVLYCIMAEAGEYEDFELAEYAFLGTLHDIGAFKVEKGMEMLQFEVANPMPHAIYGYLFLKYVSPMDEVARVIMYSHVENRNLSGVKFENKEISNYIFLAGRYDLYHHSLGERFDYNKLIRSNAGTHYSEKGLELLDAALVKRDIQQKLADKSYKEEMDHFYDDLIFSDEEKEKYLEMLMYISGFRNEYNVIDTITSVYVSREIALRLGCLTDEEMEQLRFGALLHDIGMLTVPLEIVNAPRKLTDEEMATLRRHVEVTSVILRDRIDPGVLAIAESHHERLDGSGYPRGLKGEDMNLPQKIMQVADTVTGLTCKRSFRPTKPKEAVISILRDEVGRNKFRMDIVETFIGNYDEIMELVHKEAEESLSMWRRLEKQYEQVKAAFVKK